MQGQQGMQGQNQTGMQGQHQGKGLTYGGQGTGINVLQDPRSLVHKLFADHSWYHNEFIVASVFKLQTLPAIKARLLKNAQEIGNGLGQLFPVLQPQSSALTQLLNDHIVAGDNVVKAIIAKQDVDAKSQALYTQGDKLADGVSQNLNLPQDQVRSMFHNHNAHIIQLATFLVNNKFGNNYIMELDAFNIQMLQMSDIIFNAAQNLGSSSNSSSGPFGQNQNQGSSSGVVSQNNSTMAQNSNSTSSP